MNRELPCSGAGGSRRGLPLARTLCLLATLAGLPAPARGQGLLDIGPSFLGEVEVPFTGSVSSSLGWDSDPGASSSPGASGAGSRRPESARGESVVWQNSIALSYEARMKGKNRLGFSGNYTNLWYLDPPPGVNDMDHNGRFVMNFSRDFTRSLTIRDSAYVSYETEPNYDIGLSVNQRTGGYFLGANRLDAEYRWNRRFSTVTGYKISSILYKDDSLDQESYTRHEISQRFRYSFRRRLVGSLTYRYDLTQYDQTDGSTAADYSGHSLLAGVDYSWNRRLSLSASAGVEYRTYDTGDRDDEVAPRVEAALNYILAKRTTARWVHSFSLDDTGRTGSQSGGYSYRTGVSLQHIINRRLSANLALNYIHQDNGDSTVSVTDGASDFGDGTEDTFYTSLALNYRLWKTWSLTGNYSYTIVQSDDELSDYDRHRLFFGVSYTF